MKFVQCEPGKLIELWLKTGIGHFAAVPLVERGQNKHNGCQWKNTFAHSYRIRFDTASFSLF